MILKHIFAGKRALLDFSSWNFPSPIHRYGGPWTAAHATTINKCILWYSRFVYICANLVNSNLWNMSGFLINLINSHHEISLELQPWLCLLMVSMFFKVHTTCMINWQEEFFPSTCNNGSDFRHKLLKGEI